MDRTPPAWEMPKPQRPSSFNIAVLNESGDGFTGKAGAQIQTVF